MDKFIKLTAEIQKAISTSLERAEVKELLTSIKGNETKYGTFKVKITNEAVDRAGEMIKSTGWDFTHYLKSPVVLWGHDYKGLPIGITTKLYQEGADTVAEGVFAPHAFAQECRQLYDLGMLRASSVGFIPKEMEGNIITKAELLEWSFVAVPCNAEALSMLSVHQLSAEAFITKGIMTAVAEEKGEVSDQINAADEMDKKREYMKPVFEVLGAMYDLVYSEEVKATDLPNIVAEVSALLSLIAKGEYTIDTEETDSETMKQFKTVIKKGFETSFITKVENDIKNGKKTEAETEAKVKATVEAAKALTVALEGLLVKEAGVECNIEAETETATDPDTKQAEDFLFLRKALQGIASNATEVLAEARKRAVDGNYY